MAHQVHWTKLILEEFIDKAMLSDQEKFIMESRVKGWTVTEQALYLKVSESTVHKTIKRLKQKYDKVQQEYPDTFPVRKYSAEETYMDTH